MTGHPLMDSPQRSVVAEAVTTEDARVIQAIPYASGLGVNLVDSLPSPVFYQGPVPACVSGQWAIKRGLDVLASGLGLLVLLPFLLLVGLLIRLDSPGPCLLRQKRVGYLGREFEMLKFRTMKVATGQDLAKLLRQDANNALMVKMDKDDPRITPLGKWLRRFSIDELPQLWNVLMGEMSLVGPRPLLAENVKLHRKRYLRRLATLPGLTCYWQISGRSSIREFDQVVALDEQYLCQWSVGRDLGILLKTVPVVLNAKGAV